MLSNMGKKKGMVGLGPGGEKEVKGKVKMIFNNTTLRTFY